MVGDSRFVLANGIRLHFLEYGNNNAPSLVIVPGITAPAALWEFVSVELARDDHVLTMDTHAPRRRTRRRRDAGAPPAPPALRARPFDGRGALRPKHCGGLIVADPPVTGPGREPYPLPVEALLEAIRLARAGVSADDLRPFFPSSMAIVA